MVSGARIAHRWAKGGEVRVSPIGPQHDSPVQLLDNKARDWAPRWTQDQDEAPQITALSTEVHQRAKEVDLPEITPQNFSDALGRARGSRAAGSNGVSNQDLKHALPAAREVLRCLVVDILRTF